MKRIDHRLNRNKKQNCLKALVDETRSRALDRQKLCMRSTTMPLISGMLWH